MPDDYLRNYAGTVMAETPGAVEAAGRAITSGQPLTWIVVDDLRTIEPKIRALALGEVRVIDADGKPVG